MNKEKCFICKSIQEKDKYVYSTNKNTAIAIKKGINKKYRIFALGEGQSTIPCNYCPNCGKKLEKGDSNE